MLIKRPVSQQSTQRRGASLVEMALVLPVFMTCLLGVIEFGRAMMVGQLVTNAAREGCRMGVIDGSTNTSVSSYIKTFLKDAAKVDEGDVAVTVTLNGVANGDISKAVPRDLITVDVSIPFSKVSYIPATFMAGTSLRGRASMRHE